MEENGTTADNIEKWKGTNLRKKNTYSSNIEDPKWGCSNIDRRQSVCGIWKTVDHPSDCLPNSISSVPLLLYFFFLLFLSCSNNLSKKFFLCNQYGLWNELMLSSLKVIFALTLSVDYTLNFKVLRTRDQWLCVQCSASCYMLNSNSYAHIPLYHLT